MSPHPHRPWGLRSGALTMHIEADSVIPFPRELVYRTYRDELPTLVEFLPHVRHIETTDRKIDAGCLVARHRWHGGGEIPLAIQRVVKDTVFRWEEESRWDDHTWTSQWTIETHAFREAVRCSGEHTFVDLGDRTRMEISGRMHIDLLRVKGLPGFLADGFARTIEQFVGRQITANLLSVSDALTRYLNAQTVT